MRYMKYLINTYTGSDTPNIHVIRGSKIGISVNYEWMQILNIKLHQILQNSIT